MLHAGSPTRRRASAQPRKVSPMRKFLIICLSVLLTYGAISCLPSTSQPKPSSVPGASSSQGYRLMFDSLSGQLHERRSTAPTVAANGAMRSPVVVTGPSAPSAPPVTAATVATTAPPATTPAPPGATGGWTYESATRVAVCESGGWGRGTGGNYVGDLGITQANWTAYGGGSDTSPAAQIAVASRIQSYPPDQNGCSGGW